MTKDLKHIKENTDYIEATDLKKVYLTATGQIACKFKKDDGVTWNGEIQKIYLDKYGEAIGYDVYIY